MPRAVCLFVLLALVPLGLSASSKSNKKSFTLFEPVQVKNVTLSPGDYQVRWTQMGNNVPVTILQGRKTVVTVPDASVVEQKNLEDTYNVTTNGTLELTKAPNGMESLTKIHFSNVAVTLSPGSVAR